MISCADLIKFKKVSFKKLVKLLSSCWAVDESFKTKLYIFVFFKEALKTMEKEQKCYVFKKLLSDFLANSTGINWRNFNNHKFLENCYAELVDENQEVAFVVIFERLKGFLENFISISKEKVF